MQGVIQEPRSANNPHYWIDASREPDSNSSSPASSNHLIHSNNLYLLSHANNPVNWYPWGAEALDRAKRENRPIFVSFGYSTCHWCHVAERTLYANPEIAELMNAWFINIKVDREQRPDLDSLYMLATQIITGHGGWPNNVFLTPDLKPFYAGSYFSPYDDENAEKVGFTTVLRSLHSAWKDQRESVQQQADIIFEAMQDAKLRAIPEGGAPLMPEAWLDRAQQTILQNYDAEYGGIGPGPTKFPNHPLLGLLLQHTSHTHHPEGLRALTHTLDSMASGGIYDHLAGGFHRYSTEPTWSIPHFEKMLYDTAQLLKIYTQAYELTQKPLYRYMAEENTRFLSQRMLAQEGGFYAAQGAETHDREGRSYLWTRQEVASILGAEAAERFFQVYTLSPLKAAPEEGLADDEGGAEGAQGVLRLHPSILSTRADGNADDIVPVLAALAEDRQRLLAAREQRPQPVRDEKIIIAWNALAIDALIYSGQTFNHPQSIELARQSAEKLWNRAYNADTEQLKHEIFRDRVQVSGFLDDYALLGIACLSLHKATGDAMWLHRSEQLAHAMLRHFSRKDRLITSMATRDLLIPPHDEGDQSMPSGTSAALELLLRLYEATAEYEYAHATHRILARLSSALSTHPNRWACAIVALNRYRLHESAHDPMSCNDDVCILPQISPHA